MQKNTKLNQYTIYIKSESINNLQNLVLPCFHESMNYKLNLKKLNLNLINIFV